MIALWVLMLRVVIASSYLTLAIVAQHHARALALPYAATVAVVAWVDYRNGSVRAR